MTKLFINVVQIIRSHSGFNTRALRWREAVRCEGCHDCEHGGYGIELLVSSRARKVVFFRNLRGTIFA